MTLLVPIPWAGRVWALPFLSVLAPSERYAAERDKKKPHKKLTDWARQSLLLVRRRWWPEREVSWPFWRLRLRGDRAAGPPGTPLEAHRAMVTRLRLDAALYEPAPPRRAGQIGRRPHLKGKRLPNLAVVAEDPSTAWKPVTLADWYGGGERSVEVVSETGVSGTTRDCRRYPCVGCWCVVIHKRRLRHPSSAVHRDLTAAPERILSWFVMRWQMEV